MFEYRIDEPKFLWIYSVIYINITINNQLINLNQSSLKSIFSTFCPYSLYISRDIECHLLNNAFLLSFLISLTHLWYPLCSFEIISFQTKKYLKVFIRFLFQCYEWCLSIWLKLLNHYQYRFVLPDPFVSWEVAFYPWALFSSYIFCFPSKNDQLSGWPITIQ